MAYYDFSHEKRIMKSKLRLCEEKHFNICIDILHMQNIII